MTRSHYLQCVAPEVRVTGIAYLKASGGWVYGYTPGANLGSREVSMRHQPVLLDLHIETT